VALMSAKCLKEPMTN